MKTRILYLLLLFAPAICIAKENGKNNNNKKDTLTAVVVYGDDYLLPGIDSMSIDRLKQYRDSLAMTGNVNPAYLMHLDLYIRIPEMSFDEVYSLIDSLFGLEVIPFPLINQINRYIAFHSPDETDKYAEEQIDTSIYPADFYYGDWNTSTPNPYNVKKLTQSDSVLIIELTDSLRNRNFVMPLKGVITSGFGWRDGKNHNGVDIDLEVWDPVVAAFDGMVRVARYYGAYGRVVVIRHFNGLETIYAHLHRFKVKPGEIVKAGQVIGLGGSSGRSTGSHLHWEVRFKGVPINPFHFIDFKENTLQTNRLVLRKTKYGYAAYPEGTVFYTVKNGDFLYKIAEMYGTNIRKLCELNGIKRNSVLYVGQKIRVL